MTAWYNEPDPYAAAWLENLIAAGHIASGVVDRRPIQEVEAFELAEFTQCHFFAGIGIWSGALGAAGWPDDRPIWTGSCPCQPFSAAGKQKGFEDERHLWPFWFDLIAQCRPPVIVGEQVDKALAWIDLVSGDLEGKDYAFGSSILSAAGFGGAHIRQRLYFVAVADDARPQGRARVSERAGERAARESGVVERLGNAECVSPRRNSGNGAGAEAEVHCQRLADGSVGNGYSMAGPTGRLADTASKRRDGLESAAGENGRHGAQDGSSSSSRPLRNSRQARSLDNADWLLCRNPAGEPSWRPVEPGTFPLAHGVTSRVGKLRAYGNALDFETATQFCEVVKEICDERSEIVTSNGV